MFKKIALPLATVAALTGAANAASDDGAKLGTAAIILLSESVCETELTPFMSLLQTALVKEVSPKELQIVSATVINSWDGSKAEKAKWCAKAAKGLKTMEVKFNASN